MVFRRGKEDGPGPKQGRRHILPGLLMMVGRRKGSSQGKGRVWEKSNAVQRAAAEAAAKIRVKAEAEIEKRDRA